MRPLLITIIFFQSAFVFSQNLDNSHFIQYRFKGLVLLKNDEKLKINGISFLDPDSVGLYSTRVEQLNTIMPKKIDSFKYRGTNMYLQNISIADIKMVRNNNHALTKGGTAGIFVGFGLGYLLGHATYEDKFDLTREENSEKRNNRGALFGLGGMVPTGITGAFLGGIILRKRFIINGEKQKLTKALEKFYQ
jgi:hypothetical protein